MKCDISSNIHMNNIFGVILLQYDNSLLISNIDFELRQDRVFLFKAQMIYNIYKLTQNLAKYTPSLCTTLVCLGVVKCKIKVVFFRGGNWISALYYFSLLLNFYLTRFFFIIDFEQDTRDTYRDINVILHLKGSVIKQNYFI